MRSLRCIVRGLNAQRRTGVLQVGPRIMPCALGRSGRHPVKREGDGRTPAGAWRVMQLLWRRDRLMRPRTALPCRPIRPDDGWCDAPADRNYNRPVRHPYAASAEHLWRDDALYDIVIILDHNRRPRVRGGGSAIFMHLARAGMGPDMGPGMGATAGCVALRRGDMLRLVARLRGGDRLVILA